MKSSCGRTNTPFDGKAPQARSSMPWKHGKEGVRIVESNICHCIDVKRGTVYSPSNDQAHKCMATRPLSGKQSFIFLRSHEFWIRGNSAWPKNMVRSLRTSRHLRMDVAGEALIVEQKQQRCRNLHLRSSVAVS